MVPPVCLASHPGLSLPEPEYKAILCYGFSVLVVVTTNGIWVDRSVAGSQITLQPHSLPKKACKILDLQFNSMSYILLVYVVY